MIIISQDENTIINFDNIEYITKDNDSRYIYAETNNDKKLIGEYKTIQRASEVLNSISNAINTQFINSKYQMPKE